MSALTSHRPASKAVSLIRAPLDELWRQRESESVRDELVRDELVRDELVRRFLPLARRLAHRYRNHSEPTEDLVQVATVGLLGAIDRFDPDRGRAFESFAVPTILGELKRHFRNTGWAAHVPRGAQEMSLRVNVAIRALTDATGRSPRVSALADYLGVEIEDVLLGLDAGAAHYADSLDAPISGYDLPDQLTLVECIGSDDEQFSLAETRVSLSTIISQLPYHERQALTLRMSDEMTQSDIAQIMGCSQMQVSRLLARAAKRARALMSPIPA